MKGKKLGTWAASLVCINSVVGIGIFFKNASIFNNNGHNGFGVLITWAFAAIIILFTALSVANIAMLKQKEGKFVGWAGWGNTLLGSKMAKFISFYNGVVYYPFITLIVSVFCISAAFQIFGLGPDKIHFGYVCLIAIAFCAICIFCDYVKKTSLVTAAKWLGYVSYLPLVLCLISMIIAFSNGTAKNLFEPKNMEPSSANINFEGIMASLPGALFAFNGFLCVGDIKNSIDNPEKKTPIIVIVSVSLISVIYVGCSLFLIFNGNAGGNVLDIFGNTGKPYMAAILFLLTVGSVCSLQGCGDVNYETIVETDIICCSNAIKKINAKKENLGTFVLAESILILHSIVLIIPAAILGTDDVVDIASNFVVFFNYILLSVLIIALVYKNFSKKYDIKIKPFVAACAIFASLFLLFSTSYLAIYVPLSDIIIRPNEINDGNGVFFSPHHLTYLVADIVLLLSTLYTPVLYVINELIEKNKK